MPMRFPFFSWARPRSTAQPERPPPPGLSPNAEADASIVSRLTFSWVYPLIKRGAAVPLQLCDLPALQPADSAQTLGPLFHSIYRRIAAADTARGNRRQSTKEKPLTSPTHYPVDDIPLTPFTSLITRLVCAIPSSVSSRTWRTLVSVACVPFFSGAAWKPLWILAAASQAFSVRFILVMLSTAVQPTPPSHWVILPLAFTLSIAGLFMSISQHAVFYNSTRAAMRARGALSHHIFHTVLQLPPHIYASLASHGTLGNLLVTDVQRLVDSFLYFHFCWFGFIEIAIVSGLLVIDMGVSALIGISCLLLLLPAQIVLANVVARARTHVTAAGDARVHAMHNLLSAIRLVKYSTWESHFNDMVKRLRGREFTYLRRVAFVRGFNTALFFSAPVIVSFVTFASHTLLFRRRLTAEIAFSTVAFYSIVTRVLVLLPLGWLASAEAAVSTKRLDKLFNLAESYSLIHPQLLMQQLPSDAEGDHTLARSIAGVTDDDVGGEDHVPKVVVSDASFSHTYGTPESGTNGESGEDHGDSGVPILKHVNLSAVSDELVCLVGAVGCGKSTLLNGILGDVRLTTGNVLVKGRVSFCAQQPWIVSGTFRYNVTMFGQNDYCTSPTSPSSSDEQRTDVEQVNDAWYDAVIKACALSTDIAGLPAGDETEIGERGVNLSGGQKARVALARTVYAKADIVILDDPLSAVDAAVSSHLVQHLLGPDGLLAGKVRIVATHQVSLLPLATRVVVLEGGATAHIGSYEELCAQGQQFHELDVKYGGDEQVRETNGDAWVEGDEQMNKAISSAEKGVESASAEQDSNVRDDDSTIKEGTQSNDKDTQETGIIEGGKLVTEEDRQYGSVSGSVLGAYVHAGGGWLTLVLLLFIFGASQVARIMSEVWVGRWTSGVPVKLDVNSAGFRRENGAFVLQLLGIVLGTVILFMVRAAAFASFSMVASRQLHDGLVKRVIHGTMSFFDTNPTGRILNRFSKDVDNMDMALPIAMQDVLQLGSLTLGAVVTISWILPWFLLAVIPVVCMFLYFQVEYKKSSRELKRLDGIAFSPIYSMVVEALAGSTTIRAFARERMFMERFDRLVNVHLSAYHVFQSSGRWLGVRLDMVSALVVFSCAFVVVAMGRTQDVGFAGVALANTLLMTGVFQYGVRQVAETENLLTSVERVRTMTMETPVERLYESEDGFPGREEWPSEGVIEFNDVQLQYRPGLLLALNGVTFATRGGERVGVVGRTGSGKTSLLVGLFRMVELYGGAIRVDGRDVAQVGLRDLRGRMAIVPQDAMLFDGTMRSNLDPTGQWSDVALWDALGRVYMRDKVARMGTESGAAGAAGDDGGVSVGVSGGLDAMVQNNGMNLSVGERQLVCLARVILSGVKIVVLDEASASLDNATDAVVQKAVREELSGRTVVTIAHRVATVMDCDRVLVVDKGRVVEFDSPRELIGRDGYFAALVRESAVNEE